MKLVELYFQNRLRPAGKRFLGAVLMKDDGRSLPAFAKRAWELQVNPGGEVVFFEVESASLTGFAESHLDKLLTEDECLALNLFTKRK